MLALIALAEPSVSAYTFGKQPYDDVRAAAAAVLNTNPCAGISPNTLTLNQLIAYILAPAWTEVANGDTTLTPSPITLSRTSPDDDKPGQYFPGQDTPGSPYHRAFWHPGIGAWQLDDSGAGKALSVERFNSLGSAMAVAQGIATRYCNDKTPLSIFGPFFSCANNPLVSTNDRDRCDRISSDLFAFLEANQSIQKDSTDRYGGAGLRICGLLAQSEIPFSCIRAVTTKPPAQGYTDSWIFPPYEGNPNLHDSPLSWPFYVYKQDPQAGDTNSYEWRYWMAEDTGYDHDFAAQRSYHQNSRYGLTWLPKADVPNVRTSVYGLCDFTTATGACGTNTVWVIARLDGSPWSGVFPQLLSFRVIGPTELHGLDTPTRFPGSSPGSYTIQYLSGGPTGFPPVSITPAPAQTLTAGGNIIFTFNFTSNACTAAGGLASASCPPPPPPPLSVSLSANRTTGNAPLNGVSLTATVTGSPTQTINYTFYCDRRDTGTNITTPYDYKLDGTNQNPLTDPVVCNYATTGTYYAKVIAEQGSGAVQRQVQINVGQTPPTCYALTLGTNDPAGGGVPTAAPPNSTGCPAGQYIAGQTVQLTASPASGWTVGSWTGTQNDGSTASTNSTVMPASAWTAGVNYVRSGPANGTLAVQATLDGQPWNGAFTYQVTGPIAPFSGASVPESFIEPPGSYTVNYIGGGPPGAQFVGTTPASTQAVSSNSTTTFTVNFSSAAGRLYVNATLDGLSWSGALTFQVTGPGISFSGSSVPIFYNEPAGTYSLQYLSGGPPNAHFQGIVPASSQVVAASGSTTFTFQFVTPQPQSAYIWVQATMDGAPWTGNLSAVVNGPSVFNVGSAPATDAVSPGTYTAQFNSGGPPHSQLASISPSVTQSVALGSTIVFTLNFQTVPVAPAVTTAVADGVTASGATPHAYVTPNGAPTLANFEYGVSSAYGNQTPQLNVGSGWDPASFAQTIGNLSCGTTYHYRIDAGNSAGTSHGMDQSFTTSACPPPQFGTVNMNATLDGTPWTGGVAYQVSGPGLSLNGSAVPNSFGSLPPGTYSVQYLSGGPNATFAGVSPASQGVNGGGTATFTLSFLTPPAAPGASFYTLTPCRLLDTRIPSDPNGPAIHSGEYRYPVFVGNCGIPSGATAVSLNVTVVNPAAAGFLSLYPELGVPPSTSTINFKAGQTRANNAVSGINTAGSMTVFCAMAAQGVTDYIIDVNGYFAPTPPSATPVTFAPRLDITVGNEPLGLAIADFDGDGKADVAVGLYDNGIGNKVRILRNIGSPGNLQFDTPFDLTTGSGPERMAAGDLDNDGKPDLVVANPGNSTITIFRNVSTPGSLAFATVQTLFFPTPHQVVIADFDGDGKPDLIVTSNSGRLVSVFHHAADPSTIAFDSRTDFSLESYPNQLAVADIDGDGKPDILVPMQNTSNLWIYRNTSSPGTVGAQTVSPFATGTSPEGIAVGDLNADGKIDILVPSVATSSLGVFTNGSSPGGPFSVTRKDWPTGAGPGAVAVGDLNRDALPDIVVANGGANTITIFRNTSSSGVIDLTAQPDLATPSGPINIVLGDLDGDGLPDIVVANHNSQNISIFLNTTGHP
ncbi:MAG TPA: FG-GAP-like repeat-containing protein [Thermoanaerobaculia bacterium]|nr:FG-GAP-like repeat-containing protein [Thermoanaerobaculia bacterium]